VKWAQETSFSLFDSNQLVLDPIFCVETDFVVYFAFRRQLLPLPVLQCQCLGSRWWKGDKLVILSLNIATGMKAMLGNRSVCFVLFV
jgi:hypothetical protein